MTTATTTLPADLPLRRDSDTAGASEGYVAWILVLALALGGLWAVRRARGGRFKWPLQRRGDGRSIPKVISSRALPPHASLHVIEWNGKELLVASSANGVTVLDSRPAQETPQ